MLTQFRNQHPLLATVIGLTTLVGGGSTPVVWYRAQPARYRDYWNVPDRQPVPPPFREAQRVALAIAEQDATWRAEMDELRRLIEEQKPGEFQLANELATTEALRGYVEKLLRLTEAAVRSFRSMEASARKLNDLLKQAPDKYRTMAELARRYAAEASRADLKADYGLLADIWEAKARAAAAHRHDVERHLTADLLDYLRDRQLLLERLLTMLHHGLDLGDLRAAAQFHQTLQDVIRGHEFLRETLRTWRARVVGASPPPVAPPAAESPEPPKADAPATARGGGDWTPVAACGGAASLFALVVGLLIKIADS